MRFLGNSEAKTDAKGRVFLPAVFRKQLQAASQECLILRKDTYQDLSLIHISEPTRQAEISYAVFCLKKKT